MEISFQRRSYIGLIYLKDIFILVVPGVVTYALGEYKYYKYFYIVDDDVLSSTLWASYIIIAFVVSLSVLFRIGRQQKAISRVKLFENEHELFHLKKILYSSIVTIFALLILLTMSGTQHALLASILGGDLISLRLSNRYSGVPTIILSALQFLNIFAWVIFGVVFRSINRSPTLILIFFLVIASTYLGNKAAIAMNIFSSIIAYATANKIKVNYRNTFKLVIGILVILTAFIVMSYYQFKNDSGFDLVSYTMIRGLMGQVGGFYEQMSLKLNDFNYIWHSVPFANYFISYPIYNKDLMMMTWGANLLSMEDTGVMNSIFGGEAFAIGGYPLLAVSPIIVALNYFIAYSVVSRLLRKLGGLTKDSSKLISAILIASSFSLTADFAGVFLLKYTIMITVFLIPPLVLKKYFYNKFYVRNFNIQ